MNGTIPIFTVIFAHFFISEEQLSFEKLSGVLLGFGGILLVFLPDFQALLHVDGFEGDLETIGLLAFVGASICYGIAIVYSRRYLRGLSPLVGPTSQLICSSLMMLPVALTLEQPLNVRPDVSSSLSLLVLGIFGTAFAYLVFYHLLENASATFLSLVTYFLPPIGIVLGIIFLNERPGWNPLVGCTLIILGVMIVNGIVVQFWNRICRVSTA